MKNEKSEVLIGTIGHNQPSEADLLKRINEILKESDKNETSNTSEREL